MTEIKKYRKGKHQYRKWGSKSKEVIVMGEEQVQKKQQIQIQIDETTAQGTYSNIASISHSEGEFTFDFIYLQPQAPKAKVRSRIITSPSHAKRLFKALHDNITRYESKFGPIKSSADHAEKKVGF